MAIDWLQLNSMPLFAALALVAQELWPLYIASSLAGFVDSIGGGGGLITIPSMLNLGLPVSLLLGTNKCISCIGSMPALLRYARAGLLPQLRLRVWLGLVLGALLSAAGGAVLSQQKVILQNLHFIIPLLLVGVMSFMLKRWFWDERRRPRTATLSSQDIEPAPQLARKLRHPLTLVGIAGIAAYDGVFGPGTGTFFLSLFERLGLKTISANAITKIFNLASNIGALLWFSYQGKVIWPVGISAGCFYLAGNYLGAGLVLKRGQALIRVVVLIATSGLLIKHLWRYI